MKTRGRLITLDIWFKPNSWNDRHIKDVVKGLAHFCNLTIISELKHHFDPQGTTYIAILSESHLSIHTYPEHDYITVDLYVCGNRARPVAAIEYFKRTYDIKRMRFTENTRGI